MIRDTESYLYSEQPKTPRGRTETRGHGPRGWRSRGVGRELEGREGRGLLSINTEAYGALQALAHVSQISGSKSAQEL